METLIRERHRQIDELLCPRIEEWMDELEESLPPSKFIRHCIRGLEDDEADHLELANELAQNEELLNEFLWRMYYEFTGNAAGSAQTPRHTVTGAAQAEEVLEESNTDGLESVVV